MANYDRGVYEPSDEVRVFDGSEEEEDDVEGSRLPLLIVLALLVLAMFGGVVWLAYTQGVARGRGETPVLTAAAGPERVAPPQGTGGNTVPYQGFKIYEQPAPPDDSADSAAPPKPAASPAPAAEAPKPASAAEAPKPVPPPVAPKVAAAPPKPASAAPVGKPAAAAPPKSVAALIQQANATPPAAEATKPAAMVKQPPAPVGGPATAAPRQLGTVAPAASPVPATKPAASGGYVLQIGAYKSQADADAAWKVYKTKHAALLSAYSDDVQQADLGEKGTWYRLRISGFADKDMATSVCDRLKADGGTCIPGR
jgi:cell division septation protein DedD